MFLMKLSKFIEDLEHVKDLLSSYGWFPGPGNSLRWWAGYDDPFHIIVTAILAQMSRWNVVDRVFRKLSDFGLVTPDSLASLGVDGLEELLKPLNFRRSKARTLIEVSKLLLGVNPDSLPLEDARRVFLEVKGIGSETADSILLFAYNKPTVPISSQLRRVAGRYGIELPKGYDEARRWLVKELNYDLYKLKLLHAATTIIAKEFCKVRKVKCNRCFLSKNCSSRKITFQGL